MSPLPILSIQNLTIGFKTKQGNRLVVQDLSFDLDSGKTLGIVGESGSGKSLTCFSLLGLLPPQAQILSGKVFFEGTDLLGLSKKELPFWRGKKIGMIFQDPVNALNPYLTIGYQLTEILTIPQPKREALKALAEVGIHDPEKVSGQYPHELSGGMCQRVVIAMLNLMNPKLLIADEPTTALDVTMQAQALKLLKASQKSHATSMIWITHDLAVAAHMCDELLVLKEGQLIERGPTEAILQQPQSDYTKMLLAAVPEL
jgi:ABC-type dipeptide/oligopeptide/nickel transport system ATPase component